MRDCGRCGKLWEVRRREKGLEAVAARRQTSFLKRGLGCSIVLVHAPFDQHGGFENNICHPQRQECIRLANSDSDSNANSGSAPTICLSGPSCTFIRSWPSVLARRVADCVDRHVGLLCDNRPADPLGPLGCAHKMHTMFRCISPIYIVCMTMHKAYA